MAGSTGRINSDNGCLLRGGTAPRSLEESEHYPTQEGWQGSLYAVKSYRPISLLQTISKVLESVVAERVLYLVETNGLLPRTHFGAKKQRSSIDALVYLQERFMTRGEARKPYH